MLLNLFSSLLIAAWLVVIAVISIQNVTDVSLHFLVFESINIPVGVVMAMSVAAGIVAQPLLFSLFKGR